MLVFGRVLFIDDFTINLSVFLMTISGILPL
jgi:hypothetical protein